MSRVYIETSIVSYLTARPSRDIVLAAHQTLTRAWWRRRRTYNLFVSQLALDEASAGDPEMRRRRLRVLTNLTVLPLTESATELARALIRHRALPQKATVDAFHIGVAAAHNVEYLLTWNCKHLANAAMRRRIEAVCKAQGLQPPIICTREELPRTKP